MMNALPNDLLNRQNDLQRFGDNVTEFFISMHDKLAQVVRRFRGTSQHGIEKIDFIFDEIIQNNYSIGSTNFKQQSVSRTNIQPSKK